jgi:hypothetical protein
MARLLLVLSANDTASSEPAVAVGESELTMSMSKRPLELS